MIILKKEKREKSELDRVEFGSDLSPDDLDLRSNNIQTEEQVNNAKLENNYNEKPSKRTK